MRLLPATFLLSCAPAAPSWTCEPADANTTGPDRWAYYDCVEATLANGEGCGPAGYPEGYGGKYARRFLEDARPRMSPEGQAWIDRVLVCLQEALDARIGPESTCEEVWTAGFDTHPDCYVDAGFCTLGFEDLVVVGTTIDAVDLSLPDQVAQVERVNALCEQAGSAAP